MTWEDLILISSDRLLWSWTPWIFVLCIGWGLGFPDGTVVKHPLDVAGDARQEGSTPGSGRSPGVGNGNPRQISCLTILWTEEPGGQPFRESHRVRCDWECMHLGQGFPSHQVSPTFILNNFFLHLSFSSPNSYYLLLWKMWRKHFILKKNIALPTLYP